MTVFTILQNFIAITQKEPCLRRKYVDFQTMLSDPCLNIAEKLCCVDINLQAALNLSNFLEEKCIIKNFLGEQLW